MRKACWLQHAITAVAYVAVTVIVGTALRAEAQSIQTVTTFAGPAHPDSPLLQGTTGTGGFLYGTTAGGGGGSDSVFKVLPNGTGFDAFATLQCATHGCSAGSVLGGPGLLQIGDLLYGTRSIGGSPNNRGTLFEVNVQTGQARALKVFQVNAPDPGTIDPGDGRNPDSGPILGADGFLYGTTPAGGVRDLGTAYKIRPDGSDFEIIHHFGCPRPVPVPNPPQCPQGTGIEDPNDPDPRLAIGPTSGVIQLSDGFLYGTTSAGGGDGQGNVLNGTIYKLSTDGATFQVIRTFINNNASPFGGLLGATDGYLYGTTANSGVAAAGTVFRIRPDGSQFLTLHTFQGIPNDGGLPLGRLIQASDGNLYGTTQRGDIGGLNDCGTVFRVTPGGTVQIVDFFRFATTGCFPSNGVIQASDGNLYGVTMSGGTTPGGSSGFGTIFRVPLTTAPPAQAPAITSANSVTFTVGVAASFTVTTTGSPTPDLTRTGAFLNGLTFTDNGNGTATLAGTPASGTGGTYRMFFTATNGVLPNATQTFTLTVARTRADCRAQVESATRQSAALLRSLTRENSRAVLAQIAALSRSVAPCVGFLLTGR
jgi:uncharacterized repeat protein (TIGR03803 family)